MKFISTLAIILLIEYMNCDCDYTKLATLKEFSVENCKNIKTGEGYCCYIETPKDTDDPKGCRPITKYEYDNIKDLIKYMKKFGGKDGDVEDKDVKVDCKSLYLQISSLIIILLLI